MKRTPLQRKTPLVAHSQLRRVSPKRVAAAQSRGETMTVSLRPSQRLAPRSKKRAAEERKYLAMRIDYLADNPNCAACGKTATEVHHTGGRDGWRLLYVPWWLPLCHDDHEWVTTNPTAAIAAGYSRKRHRGTEDVG
jgi:hypothetical protein